MGNKDIMFDSAPLVVWGHAETATTIIAASIPVLRVFVKKTEKTPRREIELALARAKEVR